MPSFKRLSIPYAKNAMNANMQIAYEIEKAAWIWHPNFKKDEKVALLFENKFELTKESEIVIHISADHRFELSVNGEFIAIGPDRSDVDHWSFHSYKLKLAQGKNIIQVRCWWIGEYAPYAQFSYRGGFIFAAEGAFAEKLNTGVGNWLVKEIKGWSFSKTFFPEFVGSAHNINGYELFADVDFITPQIIVPPMTTNEYGIKRVGWRLWPSQLKDQLLNSTKVGKIVAYFPNGLKENEYITNFNTKAEDIPLYRGIVEGEKVTIVANSNIALLIDLENYYCAYPEINVTGGADSEICVSWSEGMFCENRTKGNRNEFLNKKFMGRYDLFISEGGDNRYYRPCWWRSGRYILLSIKTANSPIVINKFSLIETRYPLELTSSFSSDNNTIEEITPLLVRGMQMCSHETYMDCPFYEQLMYVGDTRVEMLITHIMNRESSFIKRNIELFSWSMQEWGVVKEHYPGIESQLSLTFAMIYIAMVADYAMWKDDVLWVKSMLVSVRNNLEVIRKFQNESGLLENLSGWSFVDWVPSWEIGFAPNGKEISAINNLFFVMALRSAEMLECNFGDEFLAKRNSHDAAKVSKVIVENFWSEEQGMLADDLKHQHFSEHAQSLALLYDVLDDTKAKMAFNNLISAKNISRTTIYFSFYLFEVYKKYNHGNLIIERLEFWRETMNVGLKTPIESPEPTRSDCHAWGSHPLFHFFGSIAGIRPTSSGFKSLEIAPAVGDLRVLKCSCPHPNGSIEIDLKFDLEQRCTGTITLPSCEKAHFRWQGKVTELSPETVNTISI